MITLKLDEFEFDALCDTAAFSIQELFEECRECEHRGNSLECIHEIGNCIKEHWEQRPAVWKDNGNGEYTCSRCGATVYNNGMYYCPECGSEMFEGEEEC